METEIEAVTHAARQLRVLIVEDNPMDAELVVANLTRAGFDVTSNIVDAVELFAQQIKQADYDIIISDHSLPGWSPLEAMAILRASHKDIPLIVVTGALDDESAVHLTKQGAADYILKDRMARLPTAVLSALHEKELRDERKRAELALKESEEQLRQAQKMESIGRLAGGVAHDFNNLLTVINGYSELLIGRLQAGDPSYKGLTEIRKAGERAAGLTRQLLAFGRRQVLSPQVLDLNAVVTEAEGMLRRLIGEDIELFAARAADLGSVRVDPVQMQQVILNLAVNARDAMPGGGRLTIETANVELSEDYAGAHIAVKPGPYVMLAASDTGCGISPEVREHIFEPFFTTKEKGKGTGLGLSTVYGIVKQSGGNIWVYSELGKGTTFKIYLPRVGEKGEMKRVDRLTDTTPSGSETVLIVEDEAPVRSLVRQILEANGYQVLEAQHGPAAVSISSQHTGPIHLLLTDVVMPEMGGRVLAEHIKALRPDIKVLYVSGYTSNAIVHHGVLAAGTPFLQKPFTADGLARKVREVLGPAESL